MRGFGTPLNTASLGLAARATGLALLLVSAAGPAFAAVLAVTDCRDTTPGGAPGQLRRLIGDAAAGDTIVIPSCVIVLGGAHGEDGNQEGDLDISRDVTLIGQGPGLTILDGALYDRIFDIFEDATVVISGLTIRNGLGAVFTTRQGGGGIRNAGTLVLESVELSGNTGGSGMSNGAGIRNDGNLTMRSVTLRGNGGAFRGGGLFNAGTATIDHTRFTENLNGGIYSDGTLFLTNSTVSGNAREQGAGIVTGFTAFTVIAATTISGNIAEADAGGIMNFGTLVLLNSTVSGNEAGANPAFSGGVGGGIYHLSNASLSMTNSTVAFNRASSAFGGQGGGLALFGPTTVNNTIVSQNVSGDCSVTPGVVFTVLGINLSSDGSCPFGPYNGVVADPKLAPLGFYGGPTMTHALLPGSPARDTASIVGCPVTDQRGFPRPVGPGCDIGAYEAANLFADVPVDHWAREAIERLFAMGVVAGCATNPVQFCPDSPVTREQMAVFLLKTNEGGGYSPPPCATAPFPDVPCASPFAAWVQELVARGITAGCGGGLYCPAAPVTREQMAVFLLKTQEGAAFTPPPCTTAPFGDVPCGSPFAAWVQELVARGITAGCGAGLYCPTDPVTRGQMAVFLTRTFATP